MALIKCSVCSSRMSDKASACPKCGALVAQGGDADALARNARAAQRAKQRKLQMHSLLAMLVFGIGGAMILFAGGGTSKTSLLGSALATLGFVGYVLTRARIALAKR